MARATLEADRTALATLSLAQLRRRWRQVSDAPVPRVSAAMLRLALSWELQANVHGGLSRRTSQKLDQLDAGLSECQRAPKSPQMWALKIPYAGGVGGR